MKCSFIVCSSPLPDSNQIFLFTLLADAISRHLDPFLCRSSGSLFVEVNYNNRFSLADGATFLGRFFHFS
jgi:hypothetical protein